MPFFALFLPQSHRPDVLCLQEAGKHRALRLFEELPEVFGSGPPEEHVAQRGNNVVVSSKRVKLREW